MFAERDVRERKLKKTEAIRREREELDRKLHREEVFRRRFYEGTKGREGFGVLLKKVDKPKEEEPKKKD